MKKSISVFVPGTPVAQPRPRAYSRGGKGSVYNPRNADAWKMLIANEIRCANRYGTVEGTVCASLVFIFPRPKYMLGTKYHNGQIYHSKKPDIDNLIKAVFDAITTAKAWKDDSQVFFCSAAKCYAAREDQPGVSIRLEFVDGDPQFGRPMS